MNVVLEFMLQEAKMVLFYQLWCVDPLLGYL